jgi:AraC-like DNA-binding protein
MVAILAEGMRRLGMEVPPQPRAGTAHVALQDKRALLAAAFAQGGWGALPLLGAGVAAIRGRPLHQALAASRDPADLFTRWMLMERYLHARHRVRVGAEGDCFRVEHVARDDGPAPLPQESLVVLGVLAAALEECGFGPVVVTLGSCPIYPRPASERIAAAVAPGPPAMWEVECRGTAAIPQAAGPPSLAGEALAAQVLRQVEADLLLPPSLTEAAARLRLGGRTLQRRLAGEGLTYSDVVAQARCDAAGRQLIHTAAPVAEIGFACGFSDQAHFSRVFRQRCAVPPARFRAQFGRP